MHSSGGRGSGITREMMGIPKRKDGQYKTRQIVPGESDRNQWQQFARAATPPLGIEEREAHQGYTISELILRAWAVGVPVWGADVDEEGRITSIDYSSEMRPDRGTHQFQHSPPRGEPAECGGHQDSSCDATAPSAGDGRTRWRHDVGSPGPAEADAPSLARERVAKVRAYLSNHGQSAVDIEATPAIAQIVELLAAIQDDPPGGNKAGTRTRPADPTESKTDDLDEIEQAIRRGGDSARRRAVEQRAMEVAKGHYKGKNWDVVDVSSTESYDLLCTKKGEELHVEVKGLSADARGVALTRNEVKHARGNRTQLFVLYNITVSRSAGGTPTADGGERWISRDPWKPDDKDLTPLAFLYRLPPLA